MVKPSIYLDTSVINFLFADDAPDLRKVTEEFFEHSIRAQRYATFVSEYVIAEIVQTKEDTKRTMLLSVLAEYDVTTHATVDEESVEELASVYLEKGILPPKKGFDALHVAFCVVNKIDYLVSWNYKHLANVNRERRILAANYELGYTHNFRLVTPFELADYGN